ncbi:MAG: hypothetical protein IPP45_13255 [Sphingomonadales bacterium]|nr:hypothetical protein [Sphingomonadales bacterium]
MEDSLSGGTFATTIIVGVATLLREGFSTYSSNGTELPGHGTADPLGLQLKGLFTSLQEMRKDRPSHATEILAGGYSAFLSFLRDDLLPDLAAHYPIDLDGNHTLIGDSSGGHFALRALFDPKSPFSKYIAMVRALARHLEEIEAAEAAVAATFRSRGQMSLSVRVPLKWMKVPIAFVLPEVTRSGPPNSSRSGTGQAQLTWK